jgi:hypothetical protein
MNNLAGQMLAPLALTMALVPTLVSAQTPRATLDATFGTGGRVITNIASEDLLGEEPGRPRPVGELHDSALARRYQATIVQCSHQRVRVFAARAGLSSGRGARIGSRYGWFQTCC